MIYRCPICGYEEKIVGRTDDGPISIHSKILGVTATFKNSEVKAITEAESRHVTKMHFRAEGQKR